MSRTIFSLLGVAAISSAAIACGERTRVAAQIESDQPFSVPGVDGDVCLVRLTARSRSMPRTGRKRIVVAPSDRTAVAAAGTHIIIDGKRQPVGTGRSAERALFHSKGWEPVEFHYEWRANDDERTAPPEEVLRIAMQSDLSLRTDVLRAVCDGNGDCSAGGSHDVYDLVELSWEELEVIRCGATFEYALDE